MTQCTNIFNVKQKNDNLFECTGTTVDLSNLSLVNTVNMEIYVYNDIELHITNNNKQYFRVESDEHYLHNNKVIMQKVKIQQTDPLSFPYLKKYHNVITRQIKIYQNHQLNINLIHDTFTNGKKKEQMSYIQVTGPYSFVNLLNILQLI